jgi:hypothetical protein
MRPLQERASPLPKGERVPKLPCGRLGPVFAVRLLTRLALCSISAHGFEKHRTIRFGAVALVEIATNQRRRVLLC